MFIGDLAIALSTLQVISNKNHCKARIFFI